MTNDISSAPVIASIDDISRDHATRAFNWTSFTPEVRGESRRQQYADAVNGLYAELWPLAKTEEQKALLASEMERYRQGYLGRMNAYLSSHANVASAAIAGPARFPTARNEKRSRWADNKANELHEWEAKARNAIKRKLLDARPEEVKAAAEWRQLEREIQHSLNAIDGIDAGRLPYTRSAFVNSIAGKVERLAMNGEAELVRKALQLMRDYNASHQKPAITDRHAFWAFTELAERQAAKTLQNAASGPQVIAEAEGVKIISNPAEDRVQIIFPAKPPAEMIAKLKREAWKWSPRNEAWQRKLTAAAIESAKQIVGAA